MSWKDTIKPLSIPTPTADNSVSGKTIASRTLPINLLLKTKDQINSLSNPLEGTLVYNSDTDRINVYVGDVWLECTALPSSTTTSSSSSSSSTSSTSITSL